MPPLYSITSAMTLLFGEPTKVEAPDDLAAIAAAQEWAAARSDVAWLKGIGGVVLSISGDGPVPVCRRCGATMPALSHCGDRAHEPTTDPSLIVTAKRHADWLSARNLLDQE